MCVIAAWSVRLASGTVLLSELQASFILLKYKLNATTREWMERVREKGGEDIYLQGRERK